jgi:cytochrome c551/c552
MTFRTNPTKILSVVAVAVVLSLSYLVLTPKHSERKPSSNRTQFSSPALKPMSPEILAITPYSKRALYFARGYADMAVLIQEYIGEPRVITSLDLEPHIVVEVYRYLKNLEIALDLVRDLRKIVADPSFTPKQFKESGEIIKKLMIINKDNEARASAFIFAKSMFKKGSLEIFEDQGRKLYDPRYYQKKMLDGLDSIEAQINNIYTTTSSINMTIFGFMSNSERSPIIKYFSELARSDQSFDGWVDFENDEEGLLKEAFHSLYLASLEKDLTKKKRYSLDFSLLIIAHEQWMIQSLYSQMRPDQELLKGTLVARDKVGDYKLSNQNWSDFQVRFALGASPVPLPTVRIIRKTTFAQGSIPDYYRSRIMSENGLMLIDIPEVLNSMSVEQYRTSSTLVHNRNVRAGAEIFEQSGCIGCHRMDSLKGAAVVGPDLSRIGSRLSEKEIYESIKTPNAVISKDCVTGPCPAGVMPQTYSTLLNQEELQVLVNYLKKMK